MDFVRFLSKNNTHTNQTKTLAPLIIDIKIKKETDCMSAYLLALCGQALPDIQTIHLNIFQFLEDAA